MTSRYFVLSSILLVVLISSLDTTIMNTTMPLIAEQLGHSEWYAWPFASYMIFSTVLAPVAGRLSDIFGRKNVFAAGIVVFLIGSMLCGISGTMLQLVVYRALQGVGAGIILPFPAIIAGDLFSVEKRGTIQAVFSAIWGISAVVAPLLGSLFAEYATWRWIFYINIPICLLCLVLLIPYKDEYVPRRTSVDIGGAVLFAAGVSAVLLVTIDVSSWMVYIPCGILLLLVFYVVEKRHPAPILPLNLMKNKPIAWMAVNSFLSSASLFGAASFLPLFLQHQGYSVFMSGLALIGMATGWMAMSAPAGKWILRYGYRKLIVAGNILLFCSGIWFLFLGESSGFTFVLLGTIALGLAFGLLYTVITIGSQQLVGPHEKGISTSMQMFSRNIGTAVGVTAMGAFLNDAAGDLAAAAQAEIVEGFNRMFLYSFVVSIASLAAAWFIRETVQSGHGNPSKPMQSAN